MDGKNNVDDKEMCKYKYGMRYNKMIIVMIQSM